MCINCVLKESDHRSAFFCSQRDGPCYRCLFPTPPPAAAVGSCNTSGVLGPLCGAIGALQAAEVVKILVGSPGALGTLAQFSGSHT